MSVELAHKVAQEKASRRTVANAIMSLETEKSRDKNALPEPPTVDDSSLPSQYINIPPGMTSALRINVSCESKESKSGGIYVCMYTYIFIYVCICIHIYSYTYIFIYT
jgi:hypothetical protein